MICLEPTRSEPWRPCGRPAKWVRRVLGGDQPLCGIHARAMMARSPLAVIVSLADEKAINP